MDISIFVGPLVKTISDYYGPAILAKIGIKWDVTEEMEKLSVILLTIQDVFEDAEDKQTTSKLIRHWLKELKDVAYRVEDLLDECATEEALHEPESTGSINCAAIVDIIKRFFMNNFEEIAEQRSRTERIKRFFINKYEEIAEQRSMTKRIKLLINEFEEIAKQSSNFDLINNRSSTWTTRVVNYKVDPQRETSSFPTELKFYGRDEEKECIVNLMLNNANAGNLSIYAIVGIGGLGKTTLAQMVYNDNMVKSRFQIRCWVCVSEDFELKSLIGNIIQFQSKNYVPTLDLLQNRLQEEFSGKRFLLVLDDVWNEDEAKWERLKSSLSCGAEGSSIIVTTRSDRVASLMAGSSHDHVFHPKMLSEEDCFSLFKHRAFAEGEGEHPPNLESIGKEIVKKCGGVPLAAKFLGGLLRFHREEKEWLSVKKSELSDLPQDKEDSIMRALRLSYKHLPQHLRQCFAYCSIFPKDYKIKKENLIQLWMANGFLPPNPNMELEDIGNGAFNDLVWRGFFQEVSIDDHGNTICKMHDLVHDLAFSITRGECSFVTDAAKELVVARCNIARHLTIYHCILFSPNFSLSMTPSFLRTLFQLDLYKFRTNAPPPPLNFSNHTYLRFLDLSNSAGLETLPESIGMLKLLRHLDLSETRIAILSEEVFGNLINLQTLKLSHCYNLEMLPGNMSKLTKLRHLDIYNSTRKLLGMPAGMGQLKSLHKLSDFKVSEDCGVEELQELNHLRGTLEITCLSKVKHIRDAENAKLSRKKDICDLRLNWLNSTATHVDPPRCTTAPVEEESQTNTMNDKLIADALRPHANIKKLEFYNYGISDFPRWMSSTCLISLVTLSLSNCSKCKHLPTLGLLPHLKKLSLRGISQVECIGNEFYCDEEEEGNNMMKAARGGMVVLFPALEDLELSEMPSLEEWKGWSSSLPSSSRMKEGREAQVSVFPVLKTLSIWNCPNLRTLPPLPVSINDLTIENCDGLKSLNNCLQLLTNLHELTISYCPELELVPDDFQNLVSLQSLHLEALPKLAAVPVVGSSTLETISFRSCDGLKSLNNCLQLLTNLHELTISYCPELELLPDDFQNLVSLQSLHLEALPKLAAVPVVGSSTLETISFRSCDGLTNLLQTLELYDCKNLKSLPEGLQHLTALQSLQIINCHPELHRRCQKNTGEDWHKIAHIPHIELWPPKGEDFEEDANDEDDQESNHDEDEDEDEDEDAEQHD